MIPGFWNKLGFWSSEIINTWKSKKDWLWFHSVSVGELKAIWPLILEIKTRKNKYPVMISTTTRAGFNLAINLTKEKDIFVFFFPFDIPHIIKSLLNYAKVKLLVIAETEIWPITISECYKRNIPVILVNARLSDKSYKNYKLFKFYFKNIVSLFSQILAQTEKDKNRYISLGANSEKVINAGNLKYASLNRNKGNGKSINNNQAISITENNSPGINIIFASTHPGEEEIAIKTYKELISNHQNIRLIIAPRHIERVNNISSLIKENGFNPILKTSNKKIRSTNDIFVLDTIGELMDYLRESYITVLCGSFVKVGGHNILEPISAMSYTIIGPYDFKISELSNEFKQKNALLQVQNKEELKSKISEALSNKQMVNNVITNGLSLIREHEEILEQTSKHILTYI